MNIESDPSDESQCVVLKIKVIEPLAFCETPTRSVTKPTVLSLEKIKKKVNRISRVPG
jgi:hypothetical protein